MSQTNKNTKTAPKKKKASPKKKSGAAKSKTAKKTPLTPKKLLLLVLCGAALIGMIIGAVVLAKEHPCGRHTKITPPNTEIAWGIDVSSHNGKIDWDAVSTKAEFAFVRVGYRGYTEGEINTDKQYKANLKGANKNGVPVGVYFYTQAVNEAEAREEASFMLNAIKGYDVSLPVVIDFEYAEKNGSFTGRLWDAQLNKKQRTAVINAFCDTVREAGYTPAIYASSYIFASQLQMNAIEDDVFIWVADYNSEVSYTGYYDIWQYSKTGSCDGVASANTDMNYWYTKNRLNDNQE